MLTNAFATTILPVVDLERARRFYTDTLGLRPAGTVPGGGLELSAGGGSRIELSPRATPTKAEHTVLTFEVPDVEEEVRTLERRGVRFDDYDLPGLKTKEHIATLDGKKSAWFHDPDGNILCLHERAH